MVSSSTAQIAAYSAGLLALGILVSLWPPSSDYLKWPAQTTARPAAVVVADVLVVGAGPAGLSAATTLWRHQLTVRIFDSDRPRNRWNTPVHAFPGWEGEKPSTYLSKTRRELARTGLVDFVHGEVQTIEKRDDGLFHLTTADGRDWAGRKLLLSMGVRFKTPDIAGYWDSFPKRIFHCLFTFGYEHRAANSIGILAMGFAASPMHANLLADDARKFTQHVTIYTNGDKALARAIEAAAPSNETRFDSRTITRLVEHKDSVEIEFAHGQAKHENAVVHQPYTEVSQHFVEQLGLELNERGDIVTKMPFYHTNVPGVFAAGDCASPFKIIANAVLQGANAGAGIARELPVRVTGNQT